MSCAACSPFASRTASRMRGLVHAAEIVVDRRPPAGLHHVETDGAREPIGLDETALDAVDETPGPP